MTDPGQISAHDVCEIRFGGPCSHMSNTNNSRRTLTRLLHADRSKAELLRVEQSDEPEGESEPDAEKLASVRIGRDRIAFSKCDS
jgi:hypothetical protein